MEVNVSLRTLLNINRGKKRKININQWRRNIRKRHRNAGEAYISVRNENVPEKPRPHEERLCKCKSVCKADKIQGQFGDLFTKFHSLDYNGQTAHLASCMELQEPQRRRVPEDISRRQCTVRYHILIGVKKLPVCQKTICQAFGITPRRIQHIQQKIKTDMPLRDQRGKHNNRPKKVHETDKERIKEHIKSFPHQENHYSRAASSKNCLPAELSLKKMYKLFCEKYPQCNVSRRTYTDIFQSDFNLRFGLPRSDTCTFCDKMYIKLVATSDGPERKAILVDSELHHARAEAGYKALKLDAEKANPQLVVLFTDLQQMLYCPTLTHSSVFYQRQYATYNYDIHDAGSNDATMMLWHESIGNRGSTDIASAFLCYIKHNFRPLNSGEIKKLIVWSDRCVGQNNNWRMLSMFRLLIVNRYFTQVEQKFLTNGHSFLPCDRDFLLIERKKKTAMVNVPFDWVVVIANSRPSKPFNVYYMEQKDFKDFSACENYLWKDPKCKITEYRWFKFDSDDPTRTMARTSHNIMQPWQTFSLVNKKWGAKAIRAFNYQIDALPNAYTGPIIIKEEKRKNLLDMCQYLKPEYREFYEKLE
ncbi:uncharacterized protein LOC126888407 [Diabrotica virgifera virgifera]|uniref:DUF7869 domain-containing protein n=1 Tax=Diabrotica virgifera virgifera TaxID=50390 RepID=A0ABM5KQZ1_DIAVI|nr:uncharacterized protein LOC126888407 [Diabrotica virgifera virgifera]